MAKKITIEDDVDHLDVDAALHDDEALDDDDDWDDDNFDEENLKKTDEGEW